MKDWGALKRLAQQVDDMANDVNYDDDIFDELVDKLRAITPSFIILELLAENERLASMTNQLADEGIKLSDQRDQLRAKVDALRNELELAKQKPMYSTRQAAYRYFWLRNHHGISLDGHDFVSYGDVADWRIDDAMKKGA